MKGYNMRELKKIFAENGWREERQKNHITYKHLNHKEIISIPNHKGQEICRPMVKRLLKMANVNC